MKVIICLILSTLRSEITSAIPENLRSFIKSISDELKQRRDFLESEWKNRCSKASCKESYLICSDYKPELTCGERFNVTDCKCSNIKGSMVDQNESTVQVFNRPISPTQRLSETVCAISSIDDYFKKAYKEFPLVGWQVVGTYNGIHRTYPGHELPCDYDPRYRPWYVAGASGAKNLIIILDNSRSMNEAYKLEGAKEAFKIVVETLTLSDWIGLVTFNSEATVQTQRLIQATKENKDKIISIIKSIKAEKQTNFEDALIKAYELVRASRDEEVSPISCQTIFLFLTDGEPTTGITDINKLVSLINSIEEKDKINAIIMAYGFGQDAKPELLVPITCARGGVTQFINNNLELKEKLQDYYNLLSRGITRDEVVWVEEYGDSSGLGEMTSAVLPFYDRTVNPPFLVGVLSMDFPMENFVKFTSAQEILKYLTLTGCTKINLTPCQLEAIRPKEYRCGNQNCNTVDSRISGCPNGFEHNGFKGWGPINDKVERKKCCGDNDCGLRSSNIGIIIGVSVFVLIICIIGLICWRRKSKKVKESSQKETENKMKTGADFNTEEKKDLKNKKDGIKDNFKIAPLGIETNPPIQNKLNFSDIIIQAPDK